jgi:hypothetical protein
MVNWLVCLDGSANSDAALYTAIYMMNRDSDHLFLMTVYERVLQHFPVTYTPPALAEQMHAEARRAAMKVLRRCIRVCEAYKIEHTGLLAASNHGTAAPFPPRFLGCLMLPLPHGPLLGFSLKQSSSFFLFFPPPSFSFLFCSVLPRHICRF